MNPTEKQSVFVKRIINSIGIKTVQDYFPNYVLDSLSKEQAQKIINKLGHRTARPIYGVVGRDVPFSYESY